MEIKYGSNKGDIIIDLNLRDVIDILKKEKAEIKQQIENGNYTSLEKFGTISGLLLYYEGYFNG